MKVVILNCIYDRDKKKYNNLELNGTDEVCAKYSRDVSRYDEIYDYFRINKFDSIQDIADKLKSYFQIEIDPEDVHEFLNLPFEKIYHCPECNGSLEIDSKKRIMRCTSCNEKFSLDDNYICPICKSKLRYKAKTEKLVCKSCGNAISPHRFAKPKDNWLRNEFGDGWEKVTPKGEHHNAPPLPDLGIYPNPYR